MSRRVLAGRLSWSRSVVVELDGAGDAIVRFARTRRPFEVRRLEGAPRPNGSNPSRAPVAGSAVVPDRTAWPQRSADQAAGERWRDRHPAVVTVHVVHAADPDDHASTADALDQAGLRLVPSGMRRMDLLLPPRHPLTAELALRGWIAGRIADGVVFSRILRYPWRVESDLDPRAAWVLDHLPTSARRVGRRLVTMHPMTYPELVRTAACEVVEAARQAYAPGRARSAPTASAPEGTTPFAVTRYRTLRGAFRLIPSDLWGATFVDIGAGDGRVLREAGSAGAAAVVGWELDPVLARRAALAVAGSGAVFAGDALAQPLPTDAGIVFLNNPFGPASVARLAQRVAESLAERPRPLLVIYVNPPTVEPLLDVGLLLVQCAPSHAILTTRSE